MLPIFESLLPVFLVVALGVALRQIGFVSEEVWRGTEKIAFWIMFPALLAETLIRADLSSVGASSLVATLLTAALIFGLGMWLLRRPLQRLLAIDGPAYTSMFQGATRWNGFIALAIVSRLYGQDGLALIAVALGSMVPLLQITNVLILGAYAADEPPTAGRLVRTLLRNPLIWACVVGVAVNLLGIPVYEPLLTTANIIGRAALGIGLLLVGAGLILGDALRPNATVLVAALFKLLVFPAVVALTGLAVGLSSTEFAVAMLAASMPTAMNGYILARQMGGDAPLFASIVTVQTALAFFPVPITLWLAT